MSASLNWTDDFGWVDWASSDSESKTTAKKILYKYQGDVKRNTKYQPTWEIFQSLFQEVQQSRVNY